jgi:hypothetical protein
MKLISYGCENYKPFNNKVVFELNPLTLIYGKNSSGKSAALRLIRLMLRAMTLRSQSAFPLEVDGPHGSASFFAQFEDHAEVFDLAATVQNMLRHDFKKQLLVSQTRISKLVLEAATDVFLEWAPSDNEMVNYKGIGPLPFQGLLPSAMGALTPAQWQTISNCREKFELLEKKLTHLGPIRGAIKSIYQSNTRQPMGIDGAGAPSVLSGNSELLAAAGKWYQKHMDGWRLELEPSGIAFQCKLVRGNVTVNLADAGQGMQQILPVISQQLGHQLVDDGYFLDLIEQPELHLHTAAQAPLGDLFLETAKLGRGQLIVETHSENILLRIRRRIAEGTDPNLVAVYWIEDHPEGHSSVKRIHIDRFGALDWWREGVFSEGYEEVKAIARAARVSRDKFMES